jgi:hypothetical protein
MVQTLSAMKGTNGSPDRTTIAAPSNRRCSRQAARIGLVSGRCSRRLRLIVKPFGRPEYESDKIVRTLREVHQTRNRAMSRKV